MASFKEPKLKETVRTLAADYFSRESNRTSLITITGAEIKNHGAKALILFTVMPENQEPAALDFMHRQLTGFREYFTKRVRVMRIPYFEAAIDKGEKNRQRIEEVSNIK